MTYQAPAGIPATAFTMRWFNDLPGFVKVADQGQAWTLLRFLRLLGDQADALEVLWTRIDFTPRDEGGPAGDTSDLVNPDTADAAWLPWLAQLAGVRLGAALSVQAQRDTIRSASAGWQAGTKKAVVAAAKTALTGPTADRYATVRDHQAGGSPGGQWDVTVYTPSGQTPDSAAVLAAINDARAKPAGVRLYHAYGGSTWAEIKTAYPTWAARNGKTWTQLHNDAN